MGLLSLLTVVVLSQTPAMPMEGSRLLPPGAVVFKGDALDVAASQATLEAIAAYLTDKTYISLLRVEGHVAEGKAAQASSAKRAAAVTAWLVAHGVDCQRLLPVAFGNTKPRSENKAENTRVEFINAALRGHPIGGMPVDGGGEVAGDACGRK